MGTRIWLLFAAYAVMTVAVVAIVVHAKVTIAP